MPNDTNVDIFAKTFQPIDICLRFWFKKLTTKPCADLEQFGHFIRSVKMVSAEFSQCSQVGNLRIDHRHMSSRSLLDRYFGSRWWWYQLEYIHLYPYNCHSWVHTLIDSFGLFTVQETVLINSTLSLVRLLWYYHKNILDTVPSIVLLVRSAAKGKTFVNLTLIELRFFDSIRSVFQKCVVFLKLRSSLWSR